MADDRGVLARRIARDLSSVLLGLHGALLVVLATGWAWVFRGYLLSDLVMLAVWTALSLPGIAAALFTKLSPAPAPSGGQAL